MYLSILSACINAFFTKEHRLCESVVLLACHKILVELFILPRSLIYYSKKALKTCLRVSKSQPFLYYLKSKRGPMLLWVGSVS